MSSSSSRTGTTTPPPTPRRRRTRARRKPALLSNVCAANIIAFLSSKLKCTFMLPMARLFLSHFFPHRKRRAGNSNVLVRRSGLPEQKRESDNTGTAKKGDLVPEDSIRLATFNAAMFSMAPAVVKSEEDSSVDLRGKMANDRPKSILKQPSFAKERMRVSINLPDNEISLERSKQFMSPRSSSSSSSSTSFSIKKERKRSNKSVVEVLREVNADIIGLQNVKAEEEKGMQPLSELAEALRMEYVFAESWAPEYGNAVLSRWPIKHCNVQKICDDADFRNVLKVTIEVPRVGDVNFYCTYLDHLDEGWRLKQINAMLSSGNDPHILVGGLNSLNKADYSAERWMDIVKYYEEIGKPTPKAEVMKYLKAKQYVDAKDFAGECEAVVILAKGQDVQGTCKYGTRVDYILASPGSLYKFVPGSYGVISSKDTSDHHIVKADIKVENVNQEKAELQHPNQRVVKIDKGSCKGIWRA